MIYKGYPDCKVKDGFENPEAVGKAQSGDLNYKAGGGNGKIKYYLRHKRRSVLNINTHNLVMHFPWSVLDSHSARPGPSAGFATVNRSFLPNWKRFLYLILYH